LQVLDDGRLTDGQGRTVDFKNTVIIMTSNIGSPIIQEAYASGAPSSKEQARVEQLVRNELKTHFRPEFLNRIDDIIIFHSLDERQLSQIIGIQLHHVRQRLAERGLTLSLDPAAVRYLAKEGYDPQFGARPLKRAIQEFLLDPLAMKLLEGEFKPGDRITAALDNDELKFKQDK
jgi:ATP-dependent Clp protease ATP-binding subunit ClpB